MAHITNELNVASEEEGVTFLKRVVEIFEENHIDYYIDFGALLGIIREGKLISWDTDIDIGTIDISKIKVLEEKFTEKGMELFSDLGRSAWLSPQLTIYDNKISKGKELYISIFEYELWNEKPVYKYALQINILARLCNTLYHVLDENPAKLGRTSIKTMNQMVNISKFIPFKQKIKNLFRKLDFIFCTKRIYIFPKPTTKLVDFYDTKVRIPCEAEKHVRLVYGEDWRTPNKNFSHAKIKNEYRIEKGIQIWELAKD